MQTTFTAPNPALVSTKPMRWSGYILTALPALFLAFDGAIKVLNI